MEKKWNFRQFIGELENLMSTSANIDELMYKKTFMNKFLEGEVENIIKPIKWLLVSR